MGGRQAADDEMSGDGVRRHVDPVVAAAFLLCALVDPEARLALIDPRRSLSLPKAVPCDG